MKSRHYKFDDPEQLLSTGLDEIKEQDRNLAPSAEARDRLASAFHDATQSSRTTFWYQMAAVFLIFLFSGSIWILKTREPRQNRTEINAANSIDSTEGYFPLTYGMTPEESIQRVRVKLPRSALHQFGISLKQTRNDDVTADVLVGESGVPYAIRVVQQN